MVRYKCEQCGATLESPASMTGERDTCPMCGHPQTVPDGEPRSRFWLGIGLGALLSAVTLSAAAYVSGWPGNKSASPSDNLAPSPAVEAATIAQNDKQAGRASRADAGLAALTREKVIDWAQRKGMNHLAGWDPQGESKFAGDREYSNWEADSGLFLQCAWNPSADDRITEIYLGRTQAEHGWKGVQPAFDAWQELLPGIVPRFKQMFDQYLRKPGELRLRWYGDSDYAYGVSANNKTFLEYVGPQDEIPKRRQMARAAAKVRISWYRYLVDSQKQLVAKLKPNAGEAHVQEELQKAMRDIEEEFSRMEGHAEGTGRGFRWTLRQDVVSKSAYPLPVPKDIPAASQIILHRLSAEIAGIARISRMTVAEGGVTTYKPYGQMIVAFTKHDGASHAAMGKYARVYGMDGVYQGLSELESELLQQVTLHAVNTVFAE